MAARPKGRGKGGVLLGRIGWEDIMRFPLVVLIVLILPTVMAGCGTEAWEQGASVGLREARTGTIVGISYSEDEFSLPLDSSLHAREPDTLGLLGSSVTLARAQGFTLVPKDRSWTFFLKGESVESHRVAGSPLFDRGIVWMRAQEIKVGDKTLSFQVERTSPGPLADALQPAGHFSTPSPWWRGQEVLIIRLEAAPEPARFGLYTGDGAWDVGAQAVMNFLDAYGILWEEFDETEVHSLADRFDVIWFPGGFSYNYRTAISHHQFIREFVAGGGGFVGICAGAYYASSFVEWRGVSTDYPLNLFQGRGVGPGVDSWGAHTPLNLAPRHQPGEEQGEQLPVFYFDGPYFAPQEDEHQVEKIARYDRNGEAAVIAFPYGQGRVLLLGPHPELGFDPLTGRINVEGGDGAQWPWLRSLLDSVVPENRLVSPGALP